MSSIPRFSELSRLLEMALSRRSFRKGLFSLLSDSLAFLTVVREDEAGQQSSQLRLENL